MSAVAFIELDTTAPLPRIGQPAIEGSSVRLPFSLDEEADVVATLNSKGGAAYNGSIDGSFLVFDIGEEKWDGGSLDLWLRDMVWNVGTFSWPIGVANIVEQISSPVTIQEGKYTSDHFFSSGNWGPDDYERAGPVIR